MFTSTASVLISVLTPVTTSFFNVAASSQDALPVTFSIAVQSPLSLGSPFTVNATNGSLVLSKSIHSTSLSSAQLVLVASSTTPSSIVSTRQNFTVYFLGDFPPEITSSSALLVLLNQPVGTPVYTTTVQSHFNNSDRFTYAILGGTNASQYTMNSVRVRGTCVLALCPFHAFVPSRR